MKRSVKLRGKTYVLAVAGVEELGADGKPLRLRLLRETEGIDYPRREGVFITMFVAEDAMRGKD